MAAVKHSTASYGADEECKHLLNVAADHDSCCEIKIDNRGHDYVDSITYYPRTLSCPELHYPKQSLKEPIACYISSNLLLNSYDIKHQQFEIEGRTHIFCKLPPCEELKAFSEEMANYCFDKNNCNKVKDNANVSVSQLNDFYNIITIKNLRNENITFTDKFPIDARQILDKVSVMGNIEYTDLPYLQYNYKTGATVESISWRATLFETLELYSFPFDYQYLNIKFKWQNQNRFSFIEPKLMKDKHREDINKIIEELPNISYNKHITNFMLQIQLKEKVISEIEIGDPTYYFKN
eukprot:101598_1